MKPVFITEDAKRILDSFPKGTRSTFLSTLIEKMFPDILSEISISDLKDKESIENFLDTYLGKTTNKKMGKKTAKKNKPNKKKDVWDFEIMGEIPPF